jgi:hypothetical protein
MTQLPSPPTERQRRRLAAPRLSSDPDTRSVQIGVLGTVLVHALLLLLAPYLLQVDPAQTIGRAPPARQFDIELAPDAFATPKVAPPKPAAPFKFVETNPDAPNNAPDKTNNFGAQNQQAAQEKPSPETGADRPAMEGRKDFESAQIVSGQLSPPTPPEPSSPPAEVAPAQTIAAPRAAQDPLSGTEKREGDDKDSYGSNIAKFSENAKPVPEKVEGVENAPLIEGASGQTHQEIDPKRPRPAPKLERRARPAIFAENKIGTANIGPVAFDAKWSNYGQYLQQLIETVQIQWDRILIQSKVYPASGTVVVVKFRLDKTGTVAEILSVEPSAVADQASRACVSAITMRSPYGDWTDDMVQILGESQELTFSFYYQ